MSWTEALEQAPADPVGMRYATAEGRGRSYLAWRSADGRQGIQIVHTYYGVRRYRRVARAARSLCWIPVSETWSECLPGQTLARGEG
ncbi:MAG: hypothetical protein ACO1SX_13070 [Actinomycetota bacterium]